MTFMRDNAQRRDIAAQRTRKVKLAGHGLFHVSRGRRAGLG